MFGGGFKQSLVSRVDFIKNIYMYMYMKPCIVMGDLLAVMSNVEETSTAVLKD